MNRLQNAQKQLTESLAELESAVELAQNSTVLAAAGNVADNDLTGGSGAPAHATPSIDLGLLSQELTAIEADLERAMKMIADLMGRGVSSSQDKDSL